MEKQKAQNTLFFLQPKIDIINHLVDSFFSLHQGSINIKANELSKFAITAHRISISAETIRETLRQLDKLNELQRIDRIKPIRKSIVTYWEFERNAHFNGL